MVFLLRYWRQAAVVLAVLVLAGNVALILHSEREKGVEQERTRVADSTLKVAIPQKVRAETVLVRQVDTVRQRIAHYEADTLWRHDTVRVPRDTTPRIAIPIATLARTDSTVRACSVLANACLAFRDSANAVIRSQAAIIAQHWSEPAPPHRSVWFLLGVGATLGALHFIHR